MHFCCHILRVAVFPILQGANSFPNFARSEGTPRRLPWRIARRFVFDDFLSQDWLVRKIRVPIKIKSALPPPPKNPKYPPPKRGIWWTWVYLQKERIFPGVHKIGAPISGPRIADTNFTDTRIFLKEDSRERQRGGGKKAGRGGGGAKPHEETPHRKQFPTPLTSVRSAPPPYPISLIESLRNKIGTSTPPSKKTQNDRRDRNPQLDRTQGYIVHASGSDSCSWVRPPDTWCGPQQLSLRLRKSLTQRVSKSLRALLRPRKNRGGPKGVSTKGVSMKRPNFPYFRAFYTVVSKGNSRNRLDHGYPFCGDPFGPSRKKAKT